MMDVRTTDSNPLRLKNESSRFIPNGGKKRLAPLSFPPYHQRIEKKNFSYLQTQITSSRSGCLLLSERERMFLGQTTPNSLDDYEYLNENSIDAELKCPLCMSPFQSPTSGSCGHT